MVSRKTDSPQASPKGGSAGGGSINGGKDRIAPLPVSLVGELREQIAKVRAIHEADLAKGYGDVELPDGVALKYGGRAREWGSACQVQTGSRCQSEWCRRRLSHHPI